MYDERKDTGLSVVIMVWTAEAILNLEFDGDY